MASEKERYRWKYRNVTSMSNNVNIERGLTNNSEPHQPKEGTGKL